MRMVLRSLAVVVLVLFLLSAENEVSSQECNNYGVCDTHERCPAWKEAGECRLSKSYMEKYCPGSCGVVSPQAKQSIINAIQLKSEGFGKRQVVTGSNSEQTIEVLKACVDYMASDQIIGHEHVCINEEENCSFWAGIGKVIFVFFLPKVSDRNTFSVHIFSSKLLLLFYFFFKTIFIIK